MLGGDDEAAIERARPVVEALSEPIFRTGPLGTGHAMKALNNFVAAAGFTAAAEALLVGRRFGLDPGVMVDVLNASTAATSAPSSRPWRTNLAAEVRDRLRPGLMTKDVGIAAGLADANEVESPLSRPVATDLPPRPTTSGRWPTTPPPCCTGNAKPACKGRSHPARRSTIGGR